jgi:hypothetical protein
VVDGFGFRRQKKAVTRCFSGFGFRGRIQHNIIANQQKHRHILYNSGAERPVPMISSSTAFSAARTDATKPTQCSNFTPICALHTTNSLKRLELDARTTLVRTEDKF